jgi:hypothetical protein
LLFVERRNDVTVEKKNIFPKQCNKVTIALSSNNALPHEKYALKKSGILKKKYPLDNSLEILAYCFY